MATRTPPTAPSTEGDVSANESTDDSTPELDLESTAVEDGGERGGATAPPGSSEQEQQAIMAAYLETENMLFSEFIMGPLPLIKTVVLGSATGILPTWLQKARRRHNYKKYARTARAKNMATIAFLKAKIKTMAAQISKLQNRAGKRSGGKRHQAA